MKMITAFVRTTSLENIVASLQETGITGMSVSEVRGLGDQVGLFTPYAIHDMMNIIVPDENVGMVTDIILRHAHTGLPGDGLIAVSPLDHVMEIRTKNRIA
jgi:nitrogen regulatory protein P-II 1